MGRMMKTGIFLGALGGVMAVLESIQVVAFTAGGYGLVGLGVAILATVGTILVYKGFRLVGVMIIFFSTLIGQLTGGTIGLAISVITSPPPSPIFNDTFVVSRWTVFSLIGSVLILTVIWKSRGNEKEEAKKRMKKQFERIIQVTMTIAIISFLLRANPVKAWTYDTEHDGIASTTTHWGVPLSLVGEYSPHVLKLGMKGLSFASATAKGAIYVYGEALESGWVTGAVKWYMRGTLVAPLGWFGVINDAWIRIKFQSIDLTGGGAVEKLLLHEHADPTTGTSFDEDHTDTMDIPLEKAHMYKFVLDVEVHAEVAGVIAETIADFGEVHWSDSRIQLRFMNISNVKEAWGGYSTLLVYDGTEHAEEDVLNIHAQSDVTAQHEIQNTLALDNGIYKLQLRELDEHTSHIDQVRLYAANSKG